MNAYNNPKEARSKIVHFTPFFIIPNRTQLSKYEKGQIVAYKKCGMSGYEITRKINRSKINFLKNPKE